MIKIDCIYLEQCQEEETIDVENRKYSYFKIINESGELLDIYDYVNIKGNVRIDLENGRYRIYPNFLEEYMYYDEETHTILDAKSCEEKVWTWYQE